MAETCILVDGFDDYANLTDAAIGGWTTLGSSTFQTTGNIAGNCLRCTGGSAFFGRSYSANRNLHVLFDWRTSAAATAGIMWQGKEGATEHGRLRYNGNGTFTISRAGTTVGTTPTSPNQGIANNTWYHFEVIYDCHDTTGGYVVYINGVLAMDSGGFNVDTRNAGTAGLMDTVVWAADNSSSSHDYDNIGVYTGTSPTQKGMARVLHEVANADGGQTDWTASAGTRASCVDDASQNGDTDYITSATVGHRGTFTTPSLGVTGTVLAVAPTFVSRKDDAGVRTIRAVIREGSTNYDGAVDKTQTTSYTTGQEIWETDPAGGAWSVANVNSAEVGVKVTA